MVTSNPRGLIFFDHAFRFGNYAHRNEALQAGQSRDGGGPEADRREEGRSQS